MRQRTSILLAAFALSVIVIATYRLAYAGDDDPAGHKNMYGFGDSPCLVTFDLGGSDGVEQTVLVDTEIVVVGGKRFLNGVVTDNYPEVNVAYPGTRAFVALDRIAYLQFLPAPETENDGAERRETTE
ncbi:hypothetical protein [Rubripirellula reticaptiva]|uniref:Uncharacterized protein n=1 Tax=Rubripirellula reticaptiva TaxID=2528013 RepID=A0A5C6EV67_9BACT|nr:hypothetical protein [Rubripirellula reticaptiva]TWU51526.1 hypothetical protein Poly59_31180 [Rubripirellula reticaptiva]